MQPKVSLFASSIRPHLWDAFFKSLEGTSVNVEVIFAGNSRYDELRIGEVYKYPKGGENVLFKYIKTASIKPAQCYEVARRACTGELICWVSDDCEFNNDILGKAYKYFKDNCSYKDILSIQTKENWITGWIFFNMSMHSFYGGKSSTPRMAPLGMMNRKYLEELKGIDKRYIAGQYENDITMRIYENKGKLYPFGDKNCFVEIDHKNKHGGLTSENPRPFALGYKKDREVLESSWTDGKGNVLKDRNDTFEPFEDKDILIKSQSNNLARWD